MRQLSWQDQDAAWQVKLDRSDEHIGDLELAIADFAPARAYSVRAEPGARAGETLYRLSMSRPIPTRFSALTGDALQNMRAALDCAAFGLATRNVGRALTADEELACKFPICRTAAEFDKYLGHKLIGPMLSASAEPLRAVQPAARRDQYIDRWTEQGFDPGPREQEVAHDHLFLLNYLANIDKHRRLHVVTGWPELISWSSNDNANRGWRWGTPPFDDGSVLGVLVDDPDIPAAAPALQHQIEMRVLPEPPPGATQVDRLAAVAASQTELVRLLRWLYEHISRDVLPTIFSTS